MTQIDLNSFHPVFIPGDAAQPALLLLHGTGADENDLIDIGRITAPDAAILSIRGKVKENGMNRFFKRHAEGVFDQEDLALRTDELVAFIKEARIHYGIDDRPIFALGYSNGANIAGSVLLRHPDALDGALLLRAMIPFEPENLPDLSGKPVFMGTGIMDPIIPVAQAERLAQIFEQSNAKVTMIKKPTGHNLLQSDISDMHQWWQQNV